jgi:hypothetical protein
MKTIRKPYPKNVKRSTKFGCNQVLVRTYLPPTLKELMCSESKNMSEIVREALMARYNLSESDIMVNQ